MTAGVKCAFLMQQAAFETMFPKQRWIVYDVGGKTCYPGLYSGLRRFGLQYEFNGDPSVYNNIWCSFMVKWFWGNVGQVAESENGKLVQPVCSSDNWIRYFLLFLVNIRWDLQYMIKHVPIFDINMDSSHTWLWTEHSGSSQESITQPYTLEKKQTLRLSPIVARIHSIFFACVGFCAFCFIHLQGNYHQNSAYWSFIFKVLVLMLLASCYTCSRIITKAEILNLPKAAFLGIKTTW